MSKKYSNWSNNPSSQLDLQLSEKCEDVKTNKGCDPHLHPEQLVYHFTRDPVTLFYHYDVLWSLKTVKNNIN